MKTAPLIIASMLFFAFLTIGTVTAQDELHERHQDLESQLAKLTRQLEFLELRREELRQQLADVDSDSRVEVLRREIAILEIENEMEAVRQELTGTEMRLAEVRHRRDDESAVNREVDNAKGRLEHMQVAHEHLKAAGLDELAMQVANRAERLQQRLRRAEETRLLPGEREQTSDDDDFRRRMTGAVRELNSAVLQLREEVQRLRDEMDRD